MPLKNNAENYGLLARLLHWGMAILIIGLLAVGLLMEELSAPLKYQIYGIHKALGIIVLALVIGRLAWRFYSPPPALPTTLSSLQRLASHTLHIALYIAMVVMPLSGWAMSSAGGHPVSLFGLVELPALVEKNKELGHLFNEVHELVAYALIAAIVLHISAALLHHFVFKDNILRRMLKG